MTAESPRQRSDARSNRASILAAAREELGRDPDASLEEIARAAGVVRRTLYGHFPNRQELIAALAMEARQSLEEAFTAGRRPGAEPPEALARMVLSSWTVADRYRMLVALGRSGLGERLFHATLAPLRVEANAIIERGQREGIFADHLPAPVLTLATEAVALAVLASQASEGWPDPTKEAAPIAVLIAAGVSPARARRCVRSILRQLDQSESAALSDVDRPIAHATRKP